MDRCQKVGRHIGKGGGPSWASGRIGAAAFRGTGDRMGRGIGRNKGKIREIGREGRKVEERGIKKLSGCRTPSRTEMVDNKQQLFLRHLQRSDQQRKRIRPFVSDVGPVAATCATRRNGNTIANANASMASISIPEEQGEKVNLTQSVIK